MVVALTGLAVNLFAGLNIWATLITAFAPIVLLSIYLYVRNIEDYYRLFIPIILIFLGMIAATWFVNAGYNGNLLLLNYILFTALYITARRRVRHGVYVLVALYSTLLIILHYYRPDWIIGYENEEQRFLDLLIGNLLYLTFQLLILNAFITSYNSQTERLLSHSRQLTESEEKYRVLVEESSDPIFSYTPEGRYTCVSRAFCAAVGASTEDIVGKCISEVFPPADAEIRLEFLRRAVESGKPVVSEVYSPFNARYYQTTYTPVKGEDGQVISVICVSKDVTERRNTEKALHDSYARLELFFKQSIFGAYYSEFDQPFEWNDSVDKERLLEDIDEHQFIININDEMLHQYGSTKEKLIGRPMSSFFRHDRESGRRFRRELFDKGRIHVETFELRDDNRPIWIEGDYHCTYDEIGRITGTFGVQLDITERKNSELAKERLQEQLLQTQKLESVGRLAGGVAHDFNNMLQVILGNTELVLQEELPDGSIRENLLEVRACAQRSAELTRQLLGFARKQVIAPQVLDVNEAIGHSLKMLRRLIGEDIELVWSAGANLWPVRLDPIQIDQILTNLLVNARDAIGGAGLITVRTENRRFEGRAPSGGSDSGESEFVLLSVVDNGRGMDAEVIAHIFEPFFTTKEMGKGTGLGLAMVYGIVQQNDGFIEVRSHPGEGTTFEFYFPRFRGISASAMEAGEIPAKIRGSENILLVEDEPSILKLAEMILESQGYKVLSSGSPGEALEIAASFPGAIDLLLTDVIMPEMNGRDLADALSVRHANMKRMFMSGYSADVIARHGVLEDGVSFIEKPFQIDQFCRKVRDTLDGDF